MSKDMNTLHFLHHIRPLLMALVLFFASAFVLTSCHNDDDDDKLDNRTVLIYMAADNNLSAFVNSDMQQMFDGSLKVDKEKNNIIIFVDKPGEFPYFLEVSQGQHTMVKSCEVDMNTGSEQTLHMAMQWAVERYPAKSYGLVLWGHADGWITHDTRSETLSGDEQQQQMPTRSVPKRAYGVDNGSGKQWMDIPQMAASLASLPHLNFIFADCCAFQCVESAYELRNCADYIIASPAEIPGQGAPYDTVVPAMFSQADDFYKGIVDAYFAQKTGGFDVPLSVVKTAEMESLAQATRTTLLSFVPSMEGGGRYPSVDHIIYYYDHTQFDMQDFMMHYATTDQFVEWKKAFDNAVVYRKMATEWLANHVVYLRSNYSGGFKDFTVTEERYGGMGMYVPQEASSVNIFDYPPMKLTFSIDALNTNIRKMQWYADAGLAEVGW